MRMKILILGILFSNKSISSQISELKFGQAVSKPTVIEISKLLESAKNYTGKEVVVKGTIIDVCSKRGCWMEIAGDKKFEKLRIKVNDGDMVFPLSARGRTAYVNGSLQAKELTKDQALKYLAYLASESKRKFDESSVTGPMTVYQIDAKGVVIE